MNVYYRVTISATGLLNSGTSSGFLDDWTFREWSANGGLPTTRQAGIDKARGLWRWKHMLATINLHFGNMVDFRDITKVGYFPNVNGTGIAFTLAFPYQELLEVSNDNGSFTGANAIKEAIAVALMAGVTRNMEVYDPENHPGNSDTTQIIAVGPLSVDHASAYSAITVEPVEFM